MIFSQFLIFSQFAGLAWPGLAWPGLAWPGLGKPLPKLKKGLAQPGPSLADLGGRIIFFLKYNIFLILATWILADLG